MSNDFHKIPSPFLCILVAFEKVTDTAIFVIVNDLLGFPHVIICYEREIFKWIMTKKKKRNAPYI